MQKFAKTAYVGHFEFSLGLASKLEGHPVILLGRDPRDVLTSYCSAIFGGQMSPDPFITYVLRNKLSSSDVLAALISGAREEGFVVQGVHEQFLRYYIKWLPYAAAVISYEDLLPREADWSKPIESARKILSLVNVEKTDLEILSALKEASEPGKSRTFHRGKIGRWSEVFTPAHVTLFEATAPSLLRILGYPGFDGTLSNEMKRSCAPADSTVPAQGAAVSAYSGVMPALLASLDSLSGRFNRLKTVNDQIHTRVSFVTDNDSGLGYLCWTDDYLQRTLGQVYTDHKKYDSYLRTKLQSAVLAQRIAQLTPPKYSPIVQIIDPLLAAGSRIHYIDVGCFYAAEICLVAALLEKYGEAFQATAFDPGWAGRLAKHNIEINNLSNIITYEDAAVTWQDGTALVYGEYGQCENFRTVNRMVDSENCSYPVRACTLDSYIKEKGITDKLFLKIDIQGGEYHALQGAQRVLKSQCFGLMMKFIPHALASMIRPEELLSVLPVRPYRIYALKFYQTLTSQTTSWVEIDPEEFQLYTADLQKAKEDYSYLLILFG